MKVEYINPFLQAAFAVLKELGMAGLKMGKPSAAPKIHAGRGVFVTIGLTGRLSGAVLYDMTRETATGIAGVMMGEAQTDFSNLVRDAIGELGNMISGNAMTGLKTAGFDVDITPPMVITGNDMTLANLGSFNVCLVVPVETSIGEIAVNLCVKEGT